MKTDIFNLKKIDKSKFKKSERKFLRSSIFRLSGFSICKVSNKKLEAGIEE